MLNNMKGQQLSVEQVQNAARFNAYDTASKEQYERIAALPREANKTVDQEVPIPLPHV